MANKNTFRFRNGIYDATTHIFTPCAADSQSEDSKNHPRSTNISYVEHSGTDVKHKLETLLHNIFPDLNNYYEFMHSCCDILNGYEIGTKRIHNWCGDLIGREIIRDLLSYAFGDYLVRTTTRLLTVRDNMLCDFNRYLTSINDRRILYVEFNEGCNRKVNWGTIKTLTGGDYFQYDKFLILNGKVLEIDVPSILRRIRKIHFDKVDIQPLEPTELKTYAEPFVWLITKFSQRKKMDPILHKELKMAFIEMQSRPDGEFYHDAKRNFYSLSCSAS